MTGSRCALPIPTPGPADRRLEGIPHQPVREFTVALAAMILEPAGMRRIGIELGSFHPMMLAVDHAPEPRQVALRQIGVNALKAG